MLSPILIPVPMQHSMSQGECLRLLHARKTCPLVESPSDMSAWHATQAIFSLRRGCRTGWLTQQPDTAQVGLLLLLWAFGGLPVLSKLTSTICFAAALLRCEDA